MCSGTAVLYKTYINVSSGHIYLNYQSQHTGRYSSSSSSSAAAAALLIAYSFRSSYRSLFYRSTPKLDQASFASNCSPNDIRHRHLSLLPAAFTKRRSIKMFTINIDIMTTMRTDAKRRIHYFIYIAWSGVASRTTDGAISRMTVVDSWKHLLDRTLLTTADLDDSYKWCNMVHRHLTTRDRVLVWDSDRPQQLELHEFRNLLNNFTTSLEA